MKSLRRLCAWSQPCRETDGFSEPSTWRVANVFSVAHPLDAGESQGLRVPQQDGARSPNLKVLVFGLSFVGKRWGCIRSWDSCFSRRGGHPSGGHHLIGFAKLFRLRCWCAARDRLGFSKGTCIPSQLNPGMHWAENQSHACPSAKQAVSRQPREGRALDRLSVDTPRFRSA